MYNFNGEIKHRLRKNEKSMNNNNLKKNTIWNTIGLTLNSFNSLFFLIIINRINGVNIAGIFSFAFSVACLLYVVGIYQGRTFQVADTKGELNNREYLIHKIISCIIMLVLSCLFIIIKKYDFEKSSVILLLCIYKGIEAFTETLFAYLQKNNELYLVGKSYFFRSLNGLIVFSIFDYMTKNIILSCLILVLNSLLFLFLYDFKNSRKYIVKENLRWKRVVGLYRIGFSIFAFSFLSIFIVNIPKYTLDVFMDSSYQTIFGIIVMPGTVMSLCGQYITSPALTNIVDAYNKKKYDMFENIIKKICLLLLGIGIVIEIVAFILGIPVLSFVYAIDLNDYKYDLLAILLGAICYALAGILSTALITMHKNNAQLLIYMCDAIIGMLACYFLIMKNGIHGATMGYVITMFIHVLLYILYYSKQINKLKDRVR